MAEGLTNEIYFDRIRKHVGHWNRCIKRLEITQTAEYWIIAFSKPTIINLLAIFIYLFYSNHDRI
jgi:hypothetical protein